MSLEEGQEPWRENAAKGKLAYVDGWSRRRRSIILAWSLWPRNQGSSMAAADPVLRRVSNIREERGTLNP